MKDVTFTCPVTQEYVNDLLTECFDYQNVSAFKADDGKYHWIYIIINKTNGRFLIGRRSKASTLIAVNIAKQAELQADVLRFGLNAFVKFDLCYYKTYQEMMNVAANVFGDEFINVFNELGTCYNSKPLNVDEDVETVETVKPVEASKLIDTIDFYKSKKLFHHWMTKKDEAVCVPNAECVEFIKNGFVFKCKQVKLYKDDECINPTISSKRYNDKDAYIELTQKVFDYCAKGWSLAKDWESSKKRQKSRLEKKKENAQSVPDVKPIQLSLDLDAKQPEVKQLEPKSRSFRNIVLEKDGDRRCFFLEEVKGYLKQGYFVVKDQIRVKKGEYIKTILMISKKEYAQSDEDKISMRKIKSLQLLGYLENGWEIA
jgi:hypothetical protein